MSSDTSSLTRTPVAYMTSMIARSRSDIGVSASPTDSSASISSTDSVSGRDSPTPGEAKSSMGFLSTTPSSSRKLKNAFADATFRVFVLSEYPRS